MSINSPFTFISKNLVIGAISQSNKKITWIWPYFQEIDHSTPQCHIQGCNAKISTNATSAMINHVKSQHNQDIETLNLSLHTIINFVITSGMSFQILENPFFRHLVARSVCRQTISRKIIQKKR
jgi:hypothetical protein